MPYQLSALDASSLSYITDVLLSGNTLARTLLACLDLGAGQVFAFLPSNYTRRPMTNYGYDYGLSRNESLRCLIEAVRHFLKINAASTCLFENRFANRNDGIVSGYRSRVLFFNEEVYHVVNRSSANDDVIRQAIVEADTSMSLVGACFSVREGSISPEQRDLSPSELDIFVKCTQCIIVEAFDGGGFLLWSPTVLSGEWQEE